MENTLDLATREIMWGVPYSFKVIMYVLLFVSLGIFAKGVKEKLQFVVGEKESLKKLFGKSGLINTESGFFNAIWNLNWSAFFKTIIFTGKVHRDPKAFFHAFIYYGFLILWIATDLVAIHYDTPFKIFKGPLYIVVSFLADMAGIAILLGLGFAYKRRYIDKLEKLSATKPNQEKTMYAFLVALVLLGYLIEAVRILGTGMPVGEKTWAPVGFALATVFKSFNLSDYFWATTFKSMWLIHMVNTMAFVAIIPYSKFFHFIAIPFAALVKPDRKPPVLSPMDFEDEEAESFGLATISEMSMLNRMDLLTCVECGRCTEACPANAAGKLLNPKTIITKSRDLALGRNGEEKNDLWGEAPLFESNELDACTTCGACVEECPSHINHLDVILESKRYKALTLGDLPPAAADAVNKIKINHNPWGISHDDRFKWADGLDVPVINEAEHVDYLYYVGCAGSYDASNQKVVKDTVQLLKKAGVKFAVMGKTEKCNGDPIRRFGDEYSFFEIAIENIAEMNKYKFDKVVTHCPHCLHTIGKEYAKFDDGDFETIHHTELLADLLNKGKLTPEKSVERKMTFHDPCYLGRHHGEYNAPRDILSKIPGVQVNEMEKNKDKALCCGMGGGNMWYELPEGDHLATKRLEQIGQASKEHLATACSYCMINFNSSKSQVSETENIEIDDVASVLAKSVL